MKSSLRPVLATLLLASAGCSGGSPTEPDRAGSAPPVALATAPTVTTRCTVTDNGNGTWAGVAFWSNLTVWGLNFFDATGDQRSGPLTHPTRSGDGGFSNLTFQPTGVDLLGRTGETLLVVTCPS
jgi:hypothetical protein